MAITSFPTSIHDRRTEDLALAADLIVTCVDRDGARLRAALLARRNVCCHLDVGSGVEVDANGRPDLAADVRLLAPGEGCLACVGGLREREEALREVRLPSGRTLLRVHRTWNERRAGSLITLNSLAAATGVQHWLDQLAGRIVGGVWTRLDWRSGVGLLSETQAATAGSDCPICGAI